MPGLQAPFAYALKSGTVANTALAMGTSPFDFSAAELAAADQMYVTADAYSISYTLNGTTPTTAIGHILAAAANIIVSGNRNVNTFLMIRATSDSATVTVSLLKYS